MTNTDLIKWIKTNLGPAIQQALKDYPSVITESILGGMAMRETGLKVMELLKAGNTYPNLDILVKGDYGQRSTDTQKIYHGYGYWQIDIASFPDFIKSGDWADPYKCCIQALHILELNKAYLLKQFPMIDSNHEQFLRDLVASYNCGQGGEAIVIRHGEDVDARTFGHDYSKAVWGFKAIYESL